MQQFISKDAEYSDRNEPANQEHLQPEDTNEIQPCRFRDLVRFADTQDKIMMVLGSIFSIANGFSMIFYARPLKDLINAYKPNYNFQEQVDNISYAAHGFLMNGILVFVSCALMNISWTIASQRQLVKLRKLYYQSLLRQELQWYDKNKPEEICGDMYVQTQRAQTTLVESVTSMLTCLSMSIGSIVVSFFIGWRLALVLNAYVPVVVVLNYVRSKYNIKAKNLTSDITATLNGHVFEVFENIKTVKYLGGEDHEQERYAQNLQEYKATSVPLQRKMAILWGITAFFSYSSVFALGFWYGVKLVVEGVYNSNSGQTYNIGDVVSIFFCMYISGVNFNPLSGHFANLSGCRIALAKIMHIIDRHPRKSQGIQTCMTNIDQIEFKNMVFHYNKPLFNNFNLTISKGITALVGTSGNGKSTLLNLLVKFYEPIKGNIILSNNTFEQSVKDIDEVSLRKRIGYVGQEPILLGRTMREVLIAEEISDERIWEVLNMCCISALVEEVGLDAPLKPVSGGQKQRLAIARAVLRTPEILILDEGTSALDSINQRKVLNNLKTKSNILFIIMIAHRVETLSEADQIFKITKGQVEKVKEGEINSVLTSIEEAEKKIEVLDEEYEAETEHFSQKRTEFSENESDSVKDEIKYKFKWEYLFKLLRINRKYRMHYIVGIIAAILLGSIFPTFSVILSKLASIGMTIENTEDPTARAELTSDSHTLSGLLFFFAFLNLIMIILKEFCFLEISQNLAVVLKNAAFKTTINMEMAEIDKRGKTTLIHLVNVSAESTKALASTTIASFVDVVATLAVGLSIALVYCWQITLVALLLIPLTIVTGVLQNKFLTTLSQNSDKIMKKTQQMVLESILNNRTVASLNRQEHYYNSYKTQQDLGMKVTYRNSVFSGLTVALSQCLIAFVICLIYYMAAVICQNFEVKFSDALVSIYAVMFSGVQAGTNVDFIGGISAGFLRTAQYFNIVKQSQKELQYSYLPSKTNPYNQLHQEMEEVSDSLDKDRTQQGCVEFKNVYFRYPTRKEYLFEGLSFVVKPGERVAIVGQSGTGKTTVADLLFNIYSPDQGEILIDKVSTLTYHSKQTRPRMAIVSQEPALFNRSVIDNIKYNLKAPFEEVEESARMSDAFGFIEQGNFGQEEVKLQDRDTNVENPNWFRLAGSKGSLFSGGQKQRIAIARGLIRKPNVLVMDEATSALDKDTEQEVLENIQGMNCSQIIIAHRMSTIRSCDRIIVIKKGRLAEMGTFEELVELKGEFSKLVAGSKLKEKVQ